MEALELKRQLKEVDKIVALQDESGRRYKMIKDTPINRLKMDTDTSNEVSNYIVIKQTLGNGGYGIVYKAELKDGDKSFCIKGGLHKKKYRSKEERVREQKKVNKSILKEAEHYKKLSNDFHPNLVSMHFCCVSEDHNEAFLAMDYCKGMTLSVLVKHYAEKILPSKLLRKIMREATAAVAHCQKHKLVHGDIKPSNIIFTRMDTPMKLIDFGCAIDIGKDAPWVRKIAGTWEYMALEIMLWKMHDRNSDLYSLGALFHTFATRKAPWSHLTEIRNARKDKKTLLVKDIIENEHKKCESGSPVPTGLQSALASSIPANHARKPAECEIIMKLLSFRPRDRPSCEQTIEYVNTACMKPRFAVVEDGFGEEQDYEIPICVTALDSGSDDLNTPSSSDVKRLISNHQKSASSDDEDDENTHSSLDDSSGIAEELQDEYQPAINEEKDAKKELLPNFFQELSWSMKNCAEDVGAQGESSAQAKEILLQEREDIEKDKAQLAGEKAEHKAMLEKEKAEHKAKLEREEAEHDKKLEREKAKLKREREKLEREKAEFEEMKRKEKPSQ